MPRIYQSARDAAAEAGITEDELQSIEGTGSGGAVTKTDVEAYLQGQQEEKPTQAEMIRALVLEGKSNDEIVDAVKEVHPDSAIKPGHISWEIGNQRRNDTEWWQEHRERLGEVRPGLKGIPQAEEVA